MHADVRVVFQHRLQTQLCWIPALTSIPTNVRCWERDKFTAGRLRSILSPHSPFPWSWTFRQFSFKCSRIFLCSSHSNRDAGEKRLELYNIQFCLPIIHAFLEFSCPFSSLIPVSLGQRGFVPSASRVKSFLARGWIFLVKNNDVQPQQCIVRQPVFPAPECARALWSHSSRKCPNQGKRKSHARMAR